MTVVVAEEAEVIVIPAKPLVFVHSQEAMVCPVSAVALPVRVTVEVGSVIVWAPLTLRVGGVLAARTVMRTVPEALSPPLSKTLSAKV